MYFVYIIQSEKTLKFYTGSTNNLKVGIEQLNAKKVQSTKVYTPWTMVYYEAFKSEKDARMREQRLKNYGKGFTELKKI